MVGREIPFKGEKQRVSFDTISLIHSLQGMPSQETYDHGVALAQLVLGHLLPAYASDTERAHLSFPVPPPLSFGLKAPLPAALTGDSRDIDSAEVVARAKDALEAVARAIRGDWALGAK